MPVHQSSTVKHLWTVNCPVYALVDPFTIIPTNTSIQWFP